MRKGYTWVLSINKLHKHWGLKDQQLWYILQFQCSEYYRFTLDCFKLCPFKCITFSPLSFHQVARNLSYSNQLIVFSITELTVAFNNKWNSEKLSKSTNKIWETHSIWRIFSICKQNPTKPNRLWIWGWNWFVKTWIFRMRFTED